MKKTIPTGEHFIEGNIDGVPTEPITTNPNNIVTVSLPGTNGNWDIFELEPQGVDQCAFKSKEQGTYLIGVQNGENVIAKTTSASPIPFLLTQVGEDGEYTVYSIQAQSNGMGYLTMDESMPGSQVLFQPTYKGNPKQKWIFKRPNQQTDKDRH